MSLSTQQIKEEELKLLEVSGFCLAQYCDPTKQSMLFRDISNQTTQKELDKLKTLKIKSAGMSANANLKAFLCVMLHSIYMGEVKEDILSTVKSALYNDDIDLTKVKHSNLPSQTNQQLKKLVVQFFYSIQYSHFDDRVESNFAKYPIIMDILVVFLRKILSKYNVKNADDLIFHIPTKEAYGLLVDFFDFNCRAQNQLYLFYEDRFFIYENSEGEMMMGCYAENDHQKEKEIKNVLIDLNSEGSSEEQEEEVKLEISCQESPNRSLQFRGIVGESLVLDPDTVTPFFQLDQSSSSFKVSRDTSQIEEQSDYQQSPTTMKMSKDVSLLKKMDLMQQSQQIALGSNIKMKKTVILDMQNKQQNQSENNNEEIFRQILDTPLTVNTHKALEVPFDQDNIKDHLVVKQRQKEDVKVLKKSHSETMSKPHLDTYKGKSNISEYFDNSIKSLTKQETFDNQKKMCNCVFEKRKTIKLNSLLYQINISHVEEHLMFSKKKIFGLSSGKPIETNINYKYSKDSGKEVKKGFPKGPEGGTFFKKINKVFHRNPIDHISIIATQNPQSIYSESFSRKGASPLSSSNNNNKKSISPQSVTSKPTTPPKIYLGKNPLKYSARLKSTNYPNKDNL